MSRIGLLSVLLLALVLSVPIAEATTDPGIEAVVANPTAHGDRGEYVVLSVPTDTDLSTLTIDDGEGTARFPHRDVSGTIAASTDPDAVSTDFPVVELQGEMQLSNAGETIRLRRGDEVVERVTYERAPEGEIYKPSDGGWTWEPIGATDRPVVSDADVAFRSFVLPDAPQVPIDRLEEATDRLLLGGYTLTSGRVVRTLCAATNRGVSTRVLLEREPVGGLSEREAERLDRLRQCGVATSLLGGANARYSFHHAKYAVVDDGVLVLTENWKPSGTGGRSSRGWGGYVRSPRLADALAETFRADIGFRDAIPWERARDQIDPVSSSSTPTGRFPTRFPPAETTVTRVSLLAAPDNAADAIVAAIDNASNAVRVEQISIGSRGHRFVRALLSAARRGVTVRVLLGSADYVRRDNRAIVDWLNERARSEGLPLRARLATPRSRFEKIHAKGIVVDDGVILGSINWTNESIRNNREVALHVRDPAVAAYYRRVFRADWRGGRWSLTAGLAVLSGFLTLGAAKRALAMKFDVGYSVSPDAVIEP